MELEDSKFDGFLIIKLGSKNEIFRFSQKRAFAAGKVSKKTDFDTQSTIEKLSFSVLHREKYLRPISNFVRREVRPK